MTIQIQAQANDVILPCGIDYLNEAEGDVENYADRAANQKRYILNEKYYLLS